jgi:glycosyltransferase involved in cell wall biosynthesis
MTASTSSPLRVLVVAPRVPWPLAHGGHLRLYNFLKQLGATARITLAVPQPADDWEHMPPGVEVVGMTAEHATDQHAADASVPWLFRRAWQYFGCDPRARAWLRANAHRDQFDVALLYGLATGRYFPLLHVPVVWDAVDEGVLYELRDARRRGWRRWPATLRTAAFCAALEHSVCRRVVATTLASPLDAVYARCWAGGARITAITNGVDLDYFRPATRQPDPNTVAFVGAFDFPPNVEAATRFATRVWPHLHAANPDRRFVIVGRQPGPEIHALTDIGGIEIHGDVPDVRPLLERATVVVVPTRLGGGVKNKVLEACAIGRPVVASPRALAGLCARHDEDVLCAESLDDWLNQITWLFEHPAQAAEIGARGHAWVRRAHDWRKLTRKLHRLLAEAAGRTPAPADALPTASSPPHIPAHTIQEEVACL